MTDPKTILRYALFQIPGLLILGFVLSLLVTNETLSFTSAILIVSLWVIKDVVAYPIVWRAYALTGQDDRSRLRGERGVVVEDCAPTGKIKVHGTFWRAISLDGQRHLRTGDEVRIVGDVEGLTLVVKPADRDDEM